MHLKVDGHPSSSPANEMEKINKKINAACIQAREMCVTNVKKDSQCLCWYSIAACRLNDSIRAVSCSVRVLPTLRTSMPSVFIPTPSSTNSNNSYVQHTFLKIFFSHYILRDLTVLFLPIHRCIH